MADLTSSDVYIVARGTLYPYEEKAVLATSSDPKEAKKECYALALHLNDQKPLQSMAGEMAGSLTAWGFGDNEVISVYKLKSKGENS